MKLSDIIPLYEFQSPETKNFGYLVNLSNKAYDTLSYEAKRVLDEWESANWDRGFLVQDHNKNGPLTQEITKAFAPVRAKMHELFGDTIRLHRGQRRFTPDKLSKDRQLFSWSFDEQVAKDFAHGTVKRKIPSVEDIKKAVDTYNKTGFVSFLGKKYKKNKQYPKYYDIYNRNNNYITDGDNLEKSLMDDRALQMEYDAEDQERGDVHSVDVPIDKILWLTNRLNSKEFIVALNPLD